MIGANSSGDRSQTEGDRPAHLPPFLDIGGDLAPRAPRDFREAGFSPTTLRDLALKTAYSVSQFTTESAARQLCLLMRNDLLLDVLGSADPFGFRYAISGRGREWASRLMEVSGYVGPAPVSLAS
jgi:hypothetical protein